jgi:uncharacterized membrane protein
MIILLTLVIVWYVLGVAGFIYWWTSEYDLTMGNLVSGCIFGVIGPVTWIVGWSIHGPCSDNAKTIIKKRGSK